MKPIMVTLVLTAAALCACSLRFGPIGTWSSLEPPTNSLDFTSTVVTSDGEVVFLGGIDAQTGRSINQVFRFDPRSDRWSQGAQIPMDESGYTAVALSNGSVLVAGGAGTAEGSGLAPTWLYDPQRNAWAKGGSLHVARDSAAAVQLTDGRVLIAGGTVILTTPVQLPDGTTSDVGFTNSAEIFDPQTNGWAVVGPMQVARGSITLVPLQHGGALAAGGCPFASQAFSTGDALTSAEVFDPVSGAWTPTKPMPVARCGASGLLLRDGRTLVAGGSPSNVQLGSVTDAVIYDANKHDWARAGSTVSGASAPVLLADGDVFLAAVQVGTANGHVVPLVVGGQVFDPTSGEWTFATSTPVLVTFRVGLEESRPIAGLSGRTALVILGSAGVALAFDPAGTPPPGLILDSSGLALILGAVAAALCMGLAAQYIRNRLHGGA